MVTTYSRSSDFLAYGTWNDALVDGVKEREKWLITIIGVTQYSAAPRISAWGGVCSSFLATEARGYDVDAEKYEGSGAQVGRKQHHLFEPRGILETATTMILFREYLRTAQKTWM